MTVTEPFDEFLHKWLTQWPEWGIAEVFLPVPQRPLARAWLALRGELAEAAWGGEDPTPGAAKLGWWEEELVGWARGARRHPLGLMLQKQPADWARLAAAIPALRASRAPEGDRASAIAGLQPYAEAVARVSAQLFAVDPVSPQAMAEALLLDWALHLPQRGVPAVGTDIPALLALPPLQGGARVDRIHAALLRARLRRHAAGRSGPLPAVAALLTAWRGARG